MKNLFANALDGLYWASDSLPTKKFHDLNLVIETPKFGMRQGPGWMSSPPADYGYILDTTGADGDEMDCYLGPNPESTIVYVVDQNRMDSPVFDEHKCMLGYNSMAEAKKDYYDGHTHGIQIFRNITALPLSVFKAWLKHGDISKPIILQ
jgi:hypothetical protein